MGHPQVLEAAVIARAAPAAGRSARWPAWCRSPTQDTLTKEEIIAYLEPQVAKWWLPDEVIFIEAVPKTSVGKFDKKVLRAQHAAEHTPAE